MSSEILYDPPDRPVVGGWSAGISAMMRNLGKATSINTAKRVIAKTPYVPTGDVAFDTRAIAFRDALLRGEQEAYKESHKGFLSVGL